MSKEAVDVGPYIVVDEDDEGIANGDECEGDICWKDSCQ